MRVGAGDLVESVVGVWAWVELGGVVDGCGGGGDGGGLEERVEKRGPLKGHGRGAVAPSSAPTPNSP